MSSRPGTRHGNRNNQNGEDSRSEIEAWLVNLSDSNAPAARIDPLSNGSGRIPSPPNARTPTVTNVSVSFRLDPEQSASVQATQSTPQVEQSATAANTSLSGPDENPPIRSSEESSLTTDPAYSQSHPSQPTTAQPTANSSTTQQGQTISFSIPQRSRSVRIRRIPTTRFNPPTAPAAVRNQTSNRPSDSRPPPTNRNVVPSTPSLNGRAPSRGRASSSASLPLRPRRQRLSIAEQYAWATAQGASYSSSAPNFNGGAVQTAFYSNTPAALQASRTASHPSSAISHAMAFPPPQAGMQYPAPPDFQDTTQHEMQYPYQTSVQHPYQPSMQHPSMQHPTQAGIQYSIQPGIPSHAQPTAQYFAHPVYYSHNWLPNASPPPQPSTSFGRGLEETGLVRQGNGANLINAPGTATLGLNREGQRQELERAYVSGVLAAGYYALDHFRAHGRGSGSGGDDDDNRNWGVGAQGGRGGGHRRGSGRREGRSGFW